LVPVFKGLDVEAPIFDPGLHLFRGRIVEHRPETRCGHDLTRRLPELASLADAVDVPVVLDGELVAGQGRASDFYGLLPGVPARNRRVPLTLVALDGSRSPRRRFE
jgi:ATP-dependent DNA ligase